MGSHHLWVQCRISGEKEAENNFSSYHTCTSSLFSVLCSLSSFLHFSPLPVCSSSPLFHEVFAFHFLEAKCPWLCCTSSQCEAVVSPNNFGTMIWIYHPAEVWLLCSAGCSDRAVQWHLKEECALMEQIIHMFLWDRFFEVVLSVIATTGGNVWTTFIGLFSGVCQNRVSSHLEVLRLITF